MNEMWLEERGAKGEEGWWRGEEEEEEEMCKRDERGEEGRLGARGDEILRYSPIGKEGLMQGRLARGVLKGDTGGRVTVLVSHTRLTKTL